MTIETSDFILPGVDSASLWSRETQYFLLTRHQVGGRLLLRKSLKSQYLEDPQLRETLRKEYEIGTIVGMNTDYVVSYYQMVDTAEECYLTMDFVEGETLAELIISDPDYLGRTHHFERLLLQLLEGLRAIHQNQVVHLDLKPTNIMLTHVSRDIRIIDLGLCYADAYQTTMGLTNTFASPEQLDGSGDVDARSDIYSIGRILQRLEKDLHAQCQWGRSKTYKHLIRRCLAPQKADRWQSADEMILYLRKHAESKHRTYVMLSAIGLFVFLSFIYYIFQLPATGHDYHVLYGNFSLLHGTCDAVGKISDDEKDPNWQGNIYVFSDVRHWGISFQVTGIADKAYLGDTSFHTISLPPTLQRIGTSAFEEASNLIAINIPEGVTTIGSRAFFLATGLQHVQLPSTLSAIPETCFHRCQFSSVIIPEGVTSIGLDAFAVCPDLREVSLPQTLQHIGRGVFWRCESLETISLPSSLKTIGEYTFMECTKLRQIENHATDPQSATSLFDDSIPDLHLFVPSESIERYKQSPEWNRLTIEPLSAQ